MTIRPLNKHVIMKNLFFFLLLIMPLQLLADETNANNDKSQKEANLKRENYSSKTVSFLSSHSTFNKYEYYALPDVGKGGSRIENEVVIITDLETKEKIGCLRVSTRGGSTLFFRDKYSCILDLDELDDVVKTCEYIQSVVLETKAEVSTIIKYSTLDGLEIKAEWYTGVNYGYYESAGGWNVILTTDPYYSDAKVWMNMKYFPQLIQNLKDAKEVILSKLK